MHVHVNGRLFYQLWFFYTSSDAYWACCKSSFPFPDQFWGLGLDAAGGNTALQEWHKDTTILGGQMQSAKVHTCTYMQQVYYKQMCQC